LVPTLLARGGGCQHFRFVRLVESGDEVIITYELHRLDGSGGCNTEILTFDNADKIARTEVYFGWTWPPADTSKDSPPP